MPKLYGKIKLTRLCGHMRMVAGASNAGGGTMQEKTVTPTLGGQVVTPDGGYAGMSRVTINPVPLQDKTVEPSTGGQIVQADDGSSVGLGTVTVQGAALQTKEVTPGYEAQAVEPDAGFYGLGVVNVAAVAFRETFAVENVTASSDGTYSLEFADGSTVEGTVVFNDQGLPTGLTDDQGNAVTFDEYGWPASVSKSDGSSVDIMGG